MKNGLVKNKVKRITVNPDKCIGCRACELACSAFHANPKYSSMNPTKARIRVVIDLMNDEYLPIRSTYYTRASCNGKSLYTIKGKYYSECSFCGTICPARDLFKDPDSGLPLKCDMCKDNPPQEEPLCVQACAPNALVYEEIDEEVDKELKVEELETGVKAMVNKYGLEKITDTIAQLSTKE